MRKLKIALLAVLALGVSLAGFAGLASAQNFRTEVDEGQVVDSSLYSAGRNINIRGTVNGDVYCAGQTVTIDATVHGDVLCAGQTVIIGGKVDGSVRVAGQAVTINADIARSLNVAGQDIAVAKESRVGQDATLGGNVVRLDGPVGRDLMIGSTNATIKSQIGRNMRYTGDRLTLSDGALIKGDLRYESRHTASMLSDAQVAGTVTYSQPKQEKNEGPNTVLGLNFFGIAAGISILMFGLVLVLLLPGPVHRMAAGGVERWGRTLLVGLAAAIAVPVLFIALLLSFIGWALALALLLGWILVAMLSGPITAYALGLKLFHGSKHAATVMFLGSLVLILSYYVPILGGLTVLLAYIFGSGAFVMAVKRHWGRPSYGIHEAAAPAKHK